MALASGVLFDHSKDLEAIQRKASIVFGDGMKDVEQWAGSVAHSFGLTKSQTIGLAAGMADLLVPMGFTREAATEMSKQTIGLSGALAEWSGGQFDATQTGELLTKALLGEYDGLKAVGISLSAAEVQARLAAEGNDKLTGAALDQAKAQIVMNLITEKSTDAQKAFATGAGTSQRAAAEAGAAMREGFDNVATSLSGVTGVLGPTITGFGSLAGAAGPLKTAVLAASAALGGSRIATLAASAANAVASITSYALGAAIRFMLGPIGLIITIVGLLIAAWVTDFGGIRATTEKVFAAVGKIIGDVQKWFSDLVGFIGGLPDKIGRAASGMWDGIKNAFKGAINWIIKAWNSIKFTVPSIDMGPLGKLGGFTIGTPNLPYFHEGGLVPGLPGSNVLAVLQAGERVIPRGQAGRVATVNLNVHVTSDGRTDIDTDRLASLIRGPELVNALEHMASL